MATKSYIVDMDGASVDASTVLNHLTGTSEEHGSSLVVLFLKT